MSEQVLHIDLIALGDHASATQRNDLIAAAASLRTMEHVLAVGLIEAADNSDYDLAVFFLLDAFTSLEPFGTDPRYSQFLQGSVAPVLRGFAGADVKLESDLHIKEGPSAFLALAAPDAWLIALIKPQFEVGRERVGKKGVVRDPALHEEVCNTISTWLAA